MFADFQSSNLQILISCSALKDHFDFESYITKPQIVHMVFITFGNSDLYSFYIDLICNLENVIS